MNEDVSRSEGAPKPVSESLSPGFALLYCRLSPPAFHSAFALCLNSCLPHRFRFYDLIVTEYYLPHDRPIPQDTGVKARSSNFFQKASRPRRWRTNVPKNHLTQVTIQASFILEGEGCGWLLQTSWCQPDPRGDVIIPSSCSCLCRSQYSCKPPTRQMLFSVL